MASLVLQIVTNGGITLSLVNDREARVDGNGEITIIPEELSTCKDDIEIQFMGEGDLVCGILSPLLRHLVFSFAASFLKESGKVKKKLLLFETAFLHEKTVKKSFKKDCKKLRNSEKKYFFSLFSTFFIVSKNSEK
jgi:hypothetical protein